MAKTTNFIGFHAGGGGPAGFFTLRDYPVPHLH